MADETGLVPSIDQHLTGPDALKTLVASIRAASFELEPEDALALQEAATLTVTTAEDYQRGYDLMAELGDFVVRVRTHHDRFRLPLNTLLGVVREMEHEIADPAVQHRKALGHRLATWKVAQDARDRAEAQRRQEAADQAAREAQAARAAALARMSAVEPDEKLAAMFAADAVEVANVPVSAAPVPLAPSVPKVKGHVRTTWDCEVLDVRVLMQAWLDGKCHLPEADIIAGLQSFLDKQAGSLQHELGRAYPGTTAKPTHLAISVVRRGQRT